MPFLILAVCFIVAVFAVRYARKTGRDALTWGLVGFFTGGLGLFVLSRFSRPGELNLMPVHAPEAVLGPGGLTQAEHERWSILKEVDPEIRAAARRVAEQGDEFEFNLAKKYLVLNDKSYLEGAVDATLEQVQLIKESRLHRVKRVAEIGRSTEYAEFKTQLDRANVFRVSDGHCLIFLDGMCANVTSSGRVQFFDDLSARDEAFPHDKVWVEVWGDEKQRVITALGDDIAIAYAEHIGA